MLLAPTVVTLRPTLENADPVVSERYPISAPRDGRIRR